MFRKEPSMVKDWLEHGPEYYACIQREIVEQAANMLKPGGMMLYSTCTFSIEENEATILYLLQKYPEFEVLPLPSYEGFAPGCPHLLQKQQENSDITEAQAEQLKLCVHIFPHRMDGEGHFLALLKKKSVQQEGDTSSVSFRKKTANKPMLCQEWEEFSKNQKTSIAKEGLRLYDNKLYLLPKALWNSNIRGLRFLRTGLYLGDVEKKRFEPSQAFALTLSEKNWKQTLNFSSKDERVIRYLKGETLDVEDMLTGTEKNGWYLVCVDGYSLGWGKLVGDSLRNKYYAGWRW